MNAKERLIIEGIAEIEENGIQGISMRKIAKRCNLSSGAPYKHFKNNQEFVLEIVRYVNEQWYVRQNAIINIPDLSTRRKIELISIDYIRFLVENPHFRSIIMVSNSYLNESQRNLRLEISSASAKLISIYCKEVNMPLDVQKRKTYVVLALIYGAALMFDKGALKYDDKTLEMIENMIAREFDID